jgi:hypothetical protein
METKHTELSLEDIEQYAYLISSIDEAIDELTDTQLNISSETARHFIRDAIILKLINDCEVGNEQ